MKCFPVFGCRFSFRLFNIISVYFFSFFLLCTFRLFFLLLYCWCCCCCCYVFFHSEFGFTFVCLFVCMKLCTFCIEINWSLNWELLLLIVSVLRVINARNENSWVYSVQIKSNVGHGIPWLLVYSMALFHVCVCVRACIYVYSVKLWAD